MEKNYIIRTDPVRHILFLQLSGFFALSDLENFKAEKAVAMAAIGCSPHEHLTLCDISRCNIQSQEVTAAFAELILDPNIRSRRFAMVVGSSLARMQVRRILKRDEAQCFDDYATAEKWLLEAVRAN